MKAFQNIFKILILLSSFLKLGNLERFKKIGVSDLDSFIENLVEKEFFPLSDAVGLGIGVTVLNANENNQNLNYARGFGYRDKELHSSATNKTLFPIGSITKGFVSTIVIKILNEKFPNEGEMVLEIPIRKLMDSINVTLSDRYRSESVSFRDLLSHRSCLTSHIFGVMFGSINDTQDYLYRTRYESEICPFRSMYVYNNAMYVLAGDLISKISGKPFELLVREFLDELEMTQTRLVDIEEDLETVKNLVHGYYRNSQGNLVRANLKTLRQVAVLSPAGGILSTPEDMIKYALFHLNNGMVGEKQIVPKVVMSWLSHPSISAGLNIGYGMGFILVYLPGQEPLMLHDGYWSPYGSYLSIFPKLNTGIFTASNGPGEIIPLQLQYYLHLKIWDFLTSQGSSKLSKLVKNVDLSIRPLDIQPMTPSLIKSMEVNQIKKFVWNCSDDQILGVFGNGLEESFEISYSNDVEETLEITYGQFGRGNLKKVADCIYKIDWTSDILVHFSSMSDRIELTQLLKFQSEDVVYWELAVGSQVIYIRNLTVDFFPVIPYEPDSCTAENFYGQTFT